MRRVAALSVGLSLLAPAVLPAAEFRSTAAVSVLYDGPSLQARKLFVAPRGMPFEVLASVGPWIKLRDVSGDVAWIERADVSVTRTVVSRAPLSLRVSAGEGAEAVLGVDRGVVLELIDPVAASGWVRVRHREGVSGFVRGSEVWGL